MQSTKAQDIHTAIIDGDDELVNNIIASNPDSLQELLHGWHPLHVACRYRGDNAAIISRILQATPEIVSHKTPMGSLPLHLICCFFGNQKRNLQTVLESNPDAAKIRACYSGQSFDSGWLPLHYLIRFFGECCDAVKLLIEANPLALIETCDGWLPLHLAVRYFPNCEELLEMLLDAYPGAAILDLHEQVDIMSLWDEGGGNNRRCEELLRLAIEESNRSNAEIYHDFYESQTDSSSRTNLYISKSLTRYSDGRLHSSSRSKSLIEKIADRHLLFVQDSSPTPLLEKKSIGSMFRLRHKTNKHNLHDSHIQRVAQLT